MNSPIDIESNDMLTSSSLIKNKSERNYAPIDPRVAALPKAYSPYEARQLARQKASTITVATDATDYCPKQLHPEMQKRADNKQQARNQYAARHPTIELPPNIKNPIQISPLLDLTVRHTYGPFAYSERLGAYNKQHKCEHGLAFNRYELIINNGKILEMVPLCDHQKEKLLQPIPDRECTFCGQKRLHAVQRNCMCQVKRCMHCRRSTYRRGKSYYNTCTCDSDTAEPISNWSIKRSDLNISTGMKLLSLNPPPTQRLPQYASNVESSSDTKDPYESSEDEPVVTVAQSGKDYKMTNLRSSYTNDMFEDSRQAPFAAEYSEPLEEIEMFAVPKGDCDETPVNSDLDDAIDDPPLNKAIRRSAKVYNAGKRAIDNCIVSPLATMVKLLKNQLNKFLSHAFLKTLKSTVLDRIMIPFRYLYRLIEDFVPCLSNISLVTALGNTAYNLFTASSMPKMLLELNTLIALIAPHLPDTCCLSSKDTNKTDLPSVDVEEDIAEGETKVAKTWFSRIFSIFTTSIGQSNDTYLSLLLNAFKCLLPTKMLTYHKFADMAGDFNKIFTLSKNLADIASGFFSFLPNFLKRLISRNDPDLLFYNELKDPSTPVHIAAASSMAVLVAHSKNDSELLRTYQHAARADRESAIAYIGANYPFVSTKIKTTLDMWKRMIETPFRNDVRDNEPVVISLSGPPGIGKSNFWQVFVSPLFPGKTPEQLKEMTYYRSPASQYWDGYKPEQHKIVVFDDFGANRDELTYQELISLVTIAQFMPNMASLDADSIAGNKGTVFTSPCIVLLSNIITHTANTLVSNGALNRRLGYRINCEWADGHKTVRPDLAHVTFTHLDDYSEKPQTGHKYHRSIDVHQKDILEYAIAKYSTKEKVNIAIEKFMYKPPAETFFDLSKKVPVTPKQLLDQRPKDSKQSNGKQPVQTKPQGALLPFAKLISEVLVVEMKSVVVASIFTFLAGVTTATFGFKNETFLKWVYSATAIGASLIGYFGIYKRMTAVPAEPESGETVTRKDLPIKVQAQSGSNDLQLYSVLKQNMITLVHGTRTNNALFIKSNIIIVNEHFFFSNEAESDYIPDGTTLSIIDPMVTNTYHSFKFKLSNLQRIESKTFKDLVLYQLPSQIPSRRDIIKHFWHGKTDLQHRDSFLVQTIMSGSSTELVLRYTTILENQKHIKYEVLKGGKPTEIYIQDSFVYKFRSQAGDCGSPICVDEGDAFRIIGFHTSGASIFEGSAYGIIITQDHLNHACERLAERFMAPPSRTEKFAENVTIVTTRVENGLLGSNRTIAYAAKKIFQPTTTDIIPSPLFDVISKHVTEPAALTLNDPRIVEKPEYPLLIQGANKYSTSHAMFDQDLIDIAAESISTEINSFTTSVPHRILTEHEAINGIVGQKYISRMNMSTSSGYPYVLHPKLVGEKRKLFTIDEEGDYHISNPVLRESLDERIRLAHLNLMTNEQWIDCLKDERRPIEKIKKPKTRMFSISPCSLTIFTRIYFAAFCAHMNSIRVRTFSAVGINKGSLEWHYLIKRMREVGDHSTDGDYSQWDGKMLAACFLSTLLAVNTFYGDAATSVFAKLRRVIISETTFGLHRLADLIYEVINGMPSGFDGTANFNSCVNEIYLRVCWMILVPVHFRDLTHYKRFVRSIVYGDDNGITVDQRFISVFNGINIQKVMADINITYTPASKSGEFSISKPLLEMSFLKNTTGILNGFYVPLFERAALLETINWIRKCDDHEKACEDNCNSVLRNLFFYGRDEYNLIRTAIQRQKPKYILLEFRFLLEEFLQHGSVYDPLNDYGFSRSTRPTTGLERPSLDAEFCHVLPFATEAQSGTIA
jgi:hypothetical protein